MAFETVDFLTYSKKLAGLTYFHTRALLSNENLIERRFCLSPSPQHMRTCGLYIFNVKLQKGFRTPVSSPVKELSRLMFPLTNKLPVIG